MLCSHARLVAQTTDTSVRSHQAFGLGCPVGGKAVVAISLDDIEFLDRLHSRLFGGVDRGYFTLDDGVAGANPA